MLTGLAIIGAAVAGFAVWLTVRIVNRRERWATRVAAAFLVLIVAYPLSVGPAYWVCVDPHGRVHKDWTGDVFLNLYAPIIAAYHRGPTLLSDPIAQYLALWGMP